MDLMQNRVHSCVGEFHKVCVLRQPWLHASDEANHCIPSIKPYSYIMRTSMDISPPKFTICDLCMHVHCLTDLTNISSS